MQVRWLNADEHWLPKDVGALLMAMQEWLRVKQNRLFAPNVSATFSIRCGALLAQFQAPQNTFRFLYGGRSQDCGTMEHVRLLHPRCHCMRPVCRILNLCRIC